MASSFLSKLQSAVSKAGQTVQKALTSNFAVKPLVGSSLISTIGSAVKQLTAKPTMVSPLPAQYTGQAGAAKKQAEMQSAAKKQAEINAALSLKIKQTIPLGTKPTNNQLLTTTDNTLRDTLAQQLIDLEAKLDQIPGISLSDADREAFLQKAIAQITPYYDTKKSEIEKAINTGKIRSAEDVLVFIRETSQQAEDLLKQYDIAQARTEEEFVNTMANITATETEDLAFKRDDWRVRIKAAKQGQVEKGTLTGGIGRKEVTDLLARQQMEESAITRRAGTARTEVTTAEKYDLAKITAAREEATRERVRRIGAAPAEAATTTAALGTAGLPSMAELPSQAQLEYQRGMNPYTAYKPEALTELGQEKTVAAESRKLQLEAEERLVREQEAKRLAQAAYAKEAAKGNQVALSKYLLY